MTYNKAGAKKDMKKVFIISNSSWDDIQRICQILEKKNYLATNTPCQDFERELSTADCVITLRGCDESKRGRYLREMAIYFNMPILSRMILLTETI